jgi:hypothetical protein
MMKYTMEAKERSLSFKFSHFGVLWAPPQPHFFTSYSQCTITYKVHIFSQGKFYLENSVTSSENIWPGPDFPFIGTGSRSSSTILKSFIPRIETETCTISVMFMLSSVVIQYDTKSLFFCNITVIYKIMCCVYEKLISFKKLILGEGVFQLPSVYIPLQTHHT